MVYALEVVTALEAGTQFGPYVIQRLLGEGGMGAVYEATHAALDKRVALKVLHRQVAEHQEAAARFVREGKATSSIRHEHIVDVSDAGIEDGVPYLVMEYMEGEDLRRLLDREQRLTPARAVDIMIPVASAVAAAHGVGIVHRDLKPENVFLARLGTGRVVPKVLDFGIAKVSEGQDQKGLTGTAALLGTPYYMAPEQAQSGKGADARCDQYALGVILYECLTNVRPFDHESLFGLLTNIVSGEFEPPRVVNPEIAPELEAAILRAMAKRPQDRFETVTAFAAALLPFASDLTRAMWSDILQPSDGERVLNDEGPAPTGQFAVGAARGSGTLQGVETGVTANMKRPGRSFLLAGLGAVVLLAGGGAWWAFAGGARGAEDAAEPAVPSAAAAPKDSTGEQAPGSGQPDDSSTGAESAPRTASARVTVEPESAVITLDGEEVGRGRFDGDVTLDGETHVIKAAAPGYAPEVMEFTERAPFAKIQLRRVGDSSQGVAANDVAAAEDASASPSRSEEAVERRRAARRAARARRARQRSATRRERHRSRSADRDGPTERSSSSKKAPSKPPSKVRRTANDSPILEL
jgi:serine/threonine-protein kinase